MKSTSIILLSLLLTVPVAVLAGPVDDKKSMAPAGYAPEADPFYVEINAGAIFLNTPKKDNSNLFTDVNELGLDGYNNASGDFSTDTVAASYGATFGYIFDPHPSDSWLGTNLRAEVSGNYFTSRDNKASGFAAPGGPPPDSAYWVEQLDGNTDQLISDTSFNPRVQETTRDYFYQAVATVKTDFNFGHCGLVLTPSVGFDYSHLGQHFQTTSGGDDASSFVQNEKVDTDYYGIDFGLKAEYPITKDLSVFLDAGITPMIAASTYKGQQSFEFGGGDSAADGVGDSTSTFTFRTNADLGFSYNLGPVTLKLDGGLQFWDYAATVQEAKLPSGTFLFGPSPTTDPSHLVSTTMLNPQVNASVVIPF